jgi:hypothetical protein
MLADPVIADPVIADPVIVAGRIAAVTTPLDSICCEEGRTSMPPASG